MSSAIEGVLKVYPNHVSLYIPKVPITERQVEKDEYNHNAGKSDSNQDFLQKSIDRTHSRVRDYILCNDFQWFFTLTINPDICDRHDDSSVRKVLKSYFDNIRRHNSLEYILVPERHKTGALHFHGLIKTTQSLDPTGRKDRSGRKRYQCSTALRMLGWNDWTEVGSKDALSQYVRKYITKNMITDPYKKRYYVSRNLKKPEIHYFDPRDLPDGIWDSLSDIDYAYYGEVGI